MSHLFSSTISTSLVIKNEHRDFALNPCSLGVRNGEGGMKGAGVSGFIESMYIMCPFNPLAGHCTSSS